MSSAVRRRAMTLIVLVGAWAITLGCFPVFTPEVTRRSNELSGSIRDEVASHQEKLFIIATEERAGLRRYRLALSGLMAKRPSPTVIEFSHDEATGQVAIVRESSAVATVPEEARPVRMIRQRQLRYSPERPNAEQQIAALLTNDGELPTSVYIEPLHFGDEEVSLHFRYRDQHDIIRRANLVVIPKALNQRPGLAALNRLNYLWSVPADTVVVVVGWAIFWPLGAAVTSGDGFH